MMKWLKYVEAFVLLFVSYAIAESSGLRCGTGWRGRATGS